MRVIMKHLSIYNVLIATALLSLALLAACSSEEQTYDGPSYVMFTDSLNVCPVFQENNDYKVALSATKSVPYDRKFGIEILQTESNAIEGYHYSIKSNTVTIPAGELATSVEINGIYENIADDDSLNIRMRIVSLEDVEWPYYGVTANVRLQKMCPFDINNFTRYAVVQSSFLSEFKPYSTNKRLIMTDRVEGEDNSIMLHDFLCDVKPMTTAGCNTKKQKYETLVQPLLLMPFLHAVSLEDTSAGRHFPSCFRRVGRTGALTAISLVLQYHRSAISEDT